MKNVNDVVEQVISGNLSVAAAFIERLRTPLNMLFLLQVSKELCSIGQKDQEHLFHKFLMNRWTQR